MKKLYPPHSDVDIIIMSASDKTENEKTENRDAELHDEEMGVEAELAHSRLTRQILWKMDVR